MPRQSIIELCKEDMKFSAGHFTVFSSTIRENLHGHNYNLYASFATEIGDEGLAFDYRIYKDKLCALCQTLDETVLIAEHCKYLTVTKKDNYYHVSFNNETMLFLERDVTILPIANVTVEELSNYFMQQLLANPEELRQNKIHEMVVKVFSGPGQSGSTFWNSREL